MNVPKRLGGLALAACVMAVVLSGCAALRPRNDQRMRVADEAAELARELRSSETDPFAAMEDGIDIVARARAVTNKYLAENQGEAFFAALPAMTRTRVADHMATALNDHLAVRRFVDVLAEAAALDVEATLSRMQGIEPTGESDILVVLEAVGERLDQVAEIQTRVGEALGRLRGQEEAGKPEVAVAAVTAGVSAAKDFVDSVRNDPLVQDSERLILQAGQEVAAAETARLEEMRRHLDALVAIRKSLIQRDALYAAELMSPAMRWVGDQLQYGQTLDLLVRRSERLTTQDASQKRFPLQRSPVETGKLHYGVWLDSEAVDPKSAWLENSTGLSELVFDQSPGKGKYVEVVYHVELRTIVAPPPDGEQELERLRADCWQREWQFEHTEELPILDAMQTSFTLSYPTELGDYEIQVLGPEDVEPREYEADPADEFDGLPQRRDDKVTLVFDKPPGPFLQEGEILQVKYKANRPFAEFVERVFAVAAEPEPRANCGANVQQRWAIELGMFIASLGVVLFDEHPFDLQQAIAASAEEHLYSVRLARINSQQRLDLVGQVAEALRIYYQGGVTPEQAAQMVLMAADVLATGAIASEL